MAHILKQSSFKFLGKTSQKLGLPTSQKPSRNDKNFRAKGPNVGLEGFQKILGILGRIGMDSVFLPIV